MRCRYCQDIFYEAEKKYLKGYWEMTKGTVFICGICKKRRIYGDEECQAQSVNQQA